MYVLSAPFGLRRICLIYSCTKNARDVTLKRYHRCFWQYFTQHLKMYLMIFYDVKMFYLFTKLRVCFLVTFRSQREVFFYFAYTFIILAFVKLYHFSFISTHLQTCICQVFAWNVSTYEMRICHFDHFLHFRVTEIFNRRFNVLFGKRTFFMGKCSIIINVIYLTMYANK